jgi:hypothetical protein
MSKRDRFVAELNDLAKAQGLTGILEKGKGKGSHGRYTLCNGRFVTLPDREIDPKTAAKIRKALGL